jgi:hypothetical protein
MNTAIKGYTQTNSIYTGTSVGGLYIVNVLRKTGSKSSADYVAVVRKHGVLVSEERVLKYNEIMYAKQAGTSLTSKYNNAPNIDVFSGKFGAQQVAGPVSAPIKDQKTASNNEPVDVATTLAIMNRLVQAAKKDDSIRQIIKLVANSL